MNGLILTEFTELIFSISGDIKAPENGVLIEKTLFAEGLTALSS